MAPQGQSDFAIEGIARRNSSPQVFIALSLYIQERISAERLRIVGERAQKVGTVKRTQEIFVFTTDAGIDLYIRPHTGAQSCQISLQERRVCFLPHHLRWNCVGVGLDEHSKFAYPIRIGNSLLPSL